MELSFTLFISGLMYVVGGLIAQAYGSDGHDYFALWAIGLGLLLFGGITLFLSVLRSRRLRLRSRLNDVPQPNVVSPEEVAGLSYTIADKALAAQVEQWRDLRGRVATLVTLGPATAAVIVAATGGSFDLVALFAILFLAAGIGQSIVALWQAGTRTNFTGSTLLPEDLPAGTGAPALQLALAQRSNQLRMTNVPELQRVEAMFLRAAAGFLLAVLLWSLHAAANSEVLFKLG